MLVRVMNAPINLYFDVTPIGRILNRFSKDLSVMEQQIMWPFGGFLIMLYQTLGVIIVAAIVVKWIIALLPILVYIVVKLYLKTISAIRETSRVESNTKSPLLSFMGETFNGSSTIRAFNRTEDFIRENQRLLNNNILANRWSNSVQAWFSLRMDLISIVVLSFATIFCVMYRTEGNQVFLALLFTYILLLQDFVLWTIKCFASVE